MILLALERVSKDFAVGRRTLRAVDDVDLAVDRREVLGIVGESGSGKSTLGRLIVRLIHPTHGRILFEGDDIESFNGRKVKEFRSAVQMVFQEPYGSLNPRMRIRTILDRPMRLNGLRSRHERRQRAIELLDSVGLPAASLRRYPHEFSGGQQQRIAIARALAAKPEVIVMDEPTSALDTSVQAQLLNLLSDLRRDTGIAYILISHNLAVVNHMSDRVAVMYLGQIVELASRHELFARPLHPYTRALIDTIPKLTGRDEPSAIRPVAVHDLGREAGGCRFERRCPIAVARCRVEEPELRTVSSDSSSSHWVRCHLA
jgi:oligopeptide/dipeptide ABC transporter ATP-binding protein